MAGSNLRRKAQKKQAKLVFDPVQPGCQSSMSPARLRYADPIGRMKIPTSSIARAIEGGSDGLGDNSGKAQHDDDSDLEISPSRTILTTRGDDGAWSESDGSEPEDDSKDAKQVQKKKPKSKLSTPTESPARRSLSGGSSYNASGGLAGRKKIFTRSSPSSSRKKSKPVDITSDEDEDAKPASSAVSSRRRQRSRIAFDSDDDVDLPPLSELKKKTPALDELSLQVKKEPVEEDDDEEDIRSSPLKRKRAVPKAVEESDENDDEDIVSSPAKRKRFVAGDSDDSDDLVIIPSGSRRGAFSGFAEESNGSIDFATPTRKQKASSPTKSGGRLLRPGGRLLRRQQPKKPKRTAKQKQMELLRRRRAGENITELTDSESEEERGPALYDSISELEVLKEFDDESDGKSAQQVKRKHQKHKKRNQKSDKQEDDDFVVEDDEDALGIPGYGLYDIPLEFTHNAHKTKKAHFKDAIEWLVQRKINPAFNRDDPIYKVAFRRLDDELSGQAKSTFTSSVWREGFVKALNARPGFFEEHLGLDMNRLKCDACNRSGHPATWKVVFKGKAYHKDSLEDVEPDRDSDESENSNSDEENHDYNEDGLRIADENTVYYLGSVCKSNAETAHKLTHWKYGLNEWVVDQLKEEGYFTPKNLAAREELSTKKRSQLALDITDLWEKKGELRSLYSELKGALDSASQGPKNSRWGR